jgi:hypothetical protein
LAHLLADPHSFVAGEFHPLVTVDALGFFERLADANHAFHRVTIRFGTAERKPRLGRRRRHQFYKSRAKQDRADRWWAAWVFSRRRSA